VLLGLGAMAAIDEIVFHQLLGWHHFYDRSTSEAGLVSDGLLHAASLLALVGGFFLLLDARRRETWRAGAAVAGVLVGLGAFQLWDGTVNHKVLGVHQIRYGVELLPYDLVWNLTAAGLLAAGLAVTVILIRRHGTPSARDR
jgi:uncharacterized membrane protein